jgi:hypothetical protein
MEVGQGRNWGLIKCSFWLVLPKLGLKERPLSLDQGKRELCSVNPNSDLEFRVMFRMLLFRLEKQTHLLPPIYHRLRDCTDCALILCLIHKPH